MTSIMFPLQGQMLAANFTHKLLQKAQAHPEAPIIVHLFSGTAAATAALSCAP
jgi:hypothetical protein